MRNNLRIGVGVGSGSMAGAGALAEGPSSLHNWFSSPLAGKTMRLEGDSTWANFTSLATEMTNFSTKPGEKLAGVIVSNKGNNGASLATYLNGTAPNDILDTIAAAPHLVVLRYGLNDVRLGGIPGDTIKSLTNRLAANLKKAVNQLRKALPTTDIALFIPNSMLSTDPTASGFVTTTNAFAGMTLAQAAQAATDIMWTAYKRMENLWPNVVVYDLQTDFFTRVCLPTSAQMLDILHPKNGPPVTVPFAAYMSDKLGYRAPFDAVASAAAWAANPGNPVGACAVYPRALEDPTFMTFVCSGRFSAMGANSFIDYAHLPATDTHKLDYIQQAYGLGNFQIPNTAAINTSGSNTRVSTLGAGKPTYAQSGGTVQVFRLKVAAVTYGTNLVGNGTFTTGTGWLHFGDTFLRPTIDGGTINFAGRDDDASLTSAYTLDGGSSPAGSYRVTLDMTGLSKPAWGYFQVVLKGAGNETRGSAFVTTNGLAQTLDIEADGEVSKLWLDCASTDATVDNVMLQFGV